MPQLMPLNWVFSVFVTIMLLIMMTNIYGYNYSKEFNLNYVKMKMLNKWFW